MTPPLAAAPHLMPKEAIEAKVHDPNEDVINDNKEDDPNDDGNDSDPNEQEG